MTAAHGRIVVQEIWLPSGILGSAVRAHESRGLNLMRYVTVLYPVSLDSLQRNQGSGFDVPSASTANFPRTNNAPGVPGTQHSGSSTDDRHPSNKQRASRQPQKVFDPPRPSVQAHFCPTDRSSGTAGEDR